jgi:hypothetical protein
MVAIQLPPDGRPLLLGPDHGTLGGYEARPVRLVATRTGRPSVTTAAYGGFGRGAP